MGIQLEIDKGFSSTTFTVKDDYGFNSKSISVDNWRVSDYQLEQARNAMNYAYDVDSAMQQVKQALGIY
ncbi:hypothetical protein [Enterococcus italicus]|uniref:hypothetical protein n=1 Tax=Enterococcus italicus TaxID=246144 RepID=UPI00207376F0|nr:hypothetical protein [Enterococcus italicus]MCM6880309.1 hypothetical protein [Enterococcus italicus]